MITEPGKYYKYLLKALEPWVLAKVQSGNPRGRGQGVTEYALIAGVFVVLLVPALMFLSSTLNGSWQGLSTGLSKDESALVTSGSGSPETDNPIPESTERDVSTISLVTMNGMEIRLEPQLAQPLDQTIATLGANGSTSLLANNIQTIAQDLLASGALTKKQYNALVELANQGHLLAEMMGAMDEASQRKQYANTNDFFYDETIYVDGQKTTPYEVWTQLGYSPPPGEYKYVTPGTMKGMPQGTAYTEIPENPLEPPREASPALQAFIDLYNQAERSGALSDPAVKGVIEHLAQQIALTTEAVVQAHGDVFMLYTPIEQATAKTASKVTHADSAGICTVGNGQDSGVHCAS